MNIKEMLDKRINFKFNKRQLKDILFYLYNQSEMVLEVKIYISRDNLYELEDPQKKISKLLVIKDELASNDVDFLYYFNKCKRNNNLVFKVIVSMIATESHISYNNFYIFDSSAVVWQIEEDSYEVLFENEKIAHFRNTYQQLVNISLIEKSKFELKEPLSSSADYCYNIAKSVCSKDYIDKASCVWYHSIWQYLRLLDLVSSPEWHSEFYIENMIKIFERKLSPKVLISGTADYSMLAYIIYCCKLTSNSAEIYVLDLCNTPLEMCKWYAKREKVKISVINADLFTYDFGNIKFDIICTDAFLTRFSNNQIINIIAIWKELLNQNGCIITTVRVREDKNKKDSNLSSNDLKMKYIEEACLRYEKWKHFLSISCAELKSATTLYVNNMSSNNLGNTEEVLKLLEDCGGKIIQQNTRITRGELETTKYLEIVFN